MLNTNAEISLDIKISIRQYADDRDIKVTSG